MSISGRLFIDTWCLPPGHLMKCETLGMDLGQVTNHQQRPKFCHLVARMEFADNHLIKTQRTQKILHFFRAYQTQSKSRKVENLFGANFLFELQRTCHCQAPYLGPFGPTAGPNETKSAADFIGAGVRGGCAN